MYKEPTTWELIVSLIYLTGIAAAIVWVAKRVTGRIIKRFERRKDHA
jgi:hypothetical protein